MVEDAWLLDPRLEHDTAPVGDLALSRLVSINDAVYPWLILVPRRAGVTEIAELSDSDAAELTAEIVKVSRALKRIAGCDKINVAAIGNVVPQLHVHVVGRWNGDPLWPKPVWGLMTPRPGDAAGFARFLAALQAELKLAV